MTAALDIDAHFDNRCGNQNIQFLSGSDNIILIGKTCARKSPSLKDGKTSAERYSIHRQQPGLPL